MVSDGRRGQKHDRGHWVPRPVCKRCRSTEVLYCGASRRSQLNVQNRFGQRCAYSRWASRYTRYEDDLTLVFRDVVGQIDQNNPGLEANLDTQFAFGLTYPTQRTFFSTGGSPPFIPDAQTPSNTNEPYEDVRDLSPSFASTDILTLGFGCLQWLLFVLKMRDGTVPQTISTSYSDDEQTGKTSFPSL